MNKIPEEMQRADRVISAITALVCSFLAIVLILREAHIAVVALLIWFGPMSAIEDFWPDSRPWLFVLAAVGFMAAGAVYSVLHGPSLTGAVLLAFGIFNAVCIKREFRWAALTSAQSATQTEVA